MSERNSLPGHPSNVLIRRVRQTLRMYLNARPPKDDKTWRQAWEWAYEVAKGNPISWFNAKRLYWPSFNEIATQYLLLCISQMRDASALRLPYKAMERAPIHVRVALAAPISSQPLISNASLQAV